MPKPPWRAYGSLGQRVHGGGTGADDAEPPRARPARAAALAAAALLDGDAIVADFGLPDTRADRLLPCPLAHVPRMPVVLMSGHAHARCTTVVPGLRGLRQPFAAADRLEALRRQPVPRRADDRTRAPGASAQPSTRSALAT